MASLWRRFPSDDLEGDISEVIDGQTLVRKATGDVAPTVVSGFWEAPTGGAVLVTIGVATLLLTAFTPTVLTPVVSTPVTVALSTTAFAPNIGIGVIVTPGTVAIVSTKFVPTVTATANNVATPAAIVLVMTAFIPMVSVSSSGFGILNSDNAMMFFMNSMYYR